MVAPRKPTALKVLHGDFKKNPQRRNKREPVFTSEVIPTGGMSPAAVEVWAKVSPELITKGILTGPDVPLFEAFCEAVFMEKLARRDVVRMASGKVALQPGAASPYTAWHRSVAVLNMLAGKFGLTPADRSRLVTPEGSHGSTDDLISSG